MLKYTLTNKIVLITALTVSCVDCINTYMAERAALSVDYSANSYSVSVMVEDPNDLKPDTMFDLLWVQRRVNETLLPNNDALKYITLFIPATVDSYNAVCPKGTIGCIQIFAMVEGNIIITYNPKRWRDSKEGAVETYIHELMHYVSYKIDGSGDGDHKKSEYWGVKGLVFIIFEEWKLERKN